MVASITQTIGFSFLHHISTALVKKNTTIKFKKSYIFRVLNMGSNSFQKQISFFFDLQNKTKKKNHCERII